MNEFEVLERFFKKIAVDPGIDTGHIALFMALYRRWLLNSCMDPVQVRSKSVMNEAKISSSATYFGKLNYLWRAGYFTYEPSYYGKRSSRVYFK